MLQRVVHAFRANYALAVFWTYLAAAGVALLSTFVFPPLALGLVMLAVLALVPAVLVGSVMRAADRAATRPYLRRGVCPQCRAAQKAADGSTDFACARCGVRYAPDGEWLQES